MFLDHADDNNFETDLYFLNEELQKIAYAAKDLI